MYRFWESITEPCLETANAKILVEIGCYLGSNTDYLVSYCKKHGGLLHIVDPAPKINVEETYKDYKEHFKYHPQISLNTLWQLNDYDAILIDGDHNWYTVYHELKMIEDTMKDNFPLVLFHDIGWPYDRRDLYYVPEQIPVQYRKPYQKLGIDPDTDQLSENSFFNSHLENSITYNNLQSGVLTAIEDFIKESSQEYEFYKIPILNGYGILYPKKNNYSTEFEELMKSFSLSPAIKSLMRVNDKYAAKQQSKFVQTLNAQKLAQERLKKANEEKEILQNHNRIIEESINEINNQKQIIEQELNGLKNKKEFLEQKLWDTENELSYNKKEVQMKQDRVESLQQELTSTEEKFQKNIKDINSLKNTLEKTTQLEKTHRESIRYRVGTAVIQAKSSPVDFIKLPVRLYRLMKEGNRKKNNPTEKKNCRVAAHSKSDIKNSSIKNIKNNIIPSQYSKKEILDINKNFIQLIPENQQTELVSIIIINRNGIKNLTILFDSLEKCQFYKNYEMIIVDNGSTDESLSFLQEKKNKHRISVIQNQENQSFSVANNQGAKIAKGEYLLFLNNDIEVTDGWLDELITALKTNTKSGAIGAKLIYPEIPKDQLNAGKNYLIQHKGIAFNNREFNGFTFFSPYNMGNGDQPFTDKLSVGPIQERAAVTAAVMLMKKEIFEEVDGFDENYVYGYEDVDICLKIHRKGYKNYYCPSSLLFHYEFGTQSNCHNGELVQRRTNNISHFKVKWQHYLKDRIWKDKLSNKLLFTEKPLTIAFAVTEAHDNATAGDYFTALELATCLEDKGYRTKYLCRRDNTYYNVGSDTDVLICMLDNYDLDQIQDYDLNLVTIAWMRNHFDKWCNNPSIRQFTYLFASSRTACEYVESITNISTILFPIATNPERFSIQTKQKNIDKYHSDYVFTGSYWNSPREITTLLDPSKLPYKFKVFGKNWEEFSKFAPWHSGFLNYDEMPLVYHNSKIVIDDANIATKEYGAVNSRVFDAIAAGCLVLTNCKIGAEETFHGSLPYFSTEEELYNLITMYMENDELRKSKIKELQDYVMNNHTYQIRAQFIEDFLREQFTLKDYKVAILVPAPRWSEVNAWGDYHFAVAMQKSLEKENYMVEIRILPEWNLPFDGKYTILLRGLSSYSPKLEHINIMWNISHPDKVSIEEYNRFDGVFISSILWAQEIENQAKVPVLPLLQCTDEKIFNPEITKQSRYDLLFVGNSRKVFRQILKDLLPTKHNLAVYGKDWQGLIDSKYIKGEHILNNDLGQFYHDTKILLNDHWEDMRKKGFISNRIFDGLASGAFIISDEITGIENILPNSIITYSSSEDLKDKIDYYLSHPEERDQISKNGRDIVRKKHTFDMRIKEIIHFWNHLDISQGGDIIEK